MSRLSVRPIASRVLRAFDAISRPAPVHAHCDIPCGIYDPHLMQLAALTVVRMNQLIEGLEAASDKAGQEKNNHALARYTLVKEEHAELVKREARVIYGDYFKPEHVEKYPNIHQLTWDILKMAGKARQNIDMQAAQDLLGLTQQFAQVFWETKGVQTKTQSSNQAAGGEFVVPAN